MDLYILVPFLLASLWCAQSAPNNHGAARLDRIWKTKRNECENKVCGNMLPDESYNCVNECISKLCYDEVYAKDPLEDGEIDNVRARVFTNCLRRVTRDEKKNREQQQKQPSQQEVLI